MPTKDDLKMMQALPLSLKIRMTQQRIRDWVREFGEDGVYVSFSGGKDSTVLLHLVRDLYPGIPAVFVNTGLEYPEIQRFVREFENVEILYPKMPFPDVIRRHGYPFISKRISHVVHVMRHSRGESRYEKFFDKEYKSLFSAVRYKPLINADFDIGNQCCDVMKKSPIKHYAKLTSRMPMSGQMADEGLGRREQWLKTGCNSFNLNNPISNPMAFWTGNDVLEYIKVNRLPICSVYGDIVVQGDDGFEYDTMIGGACKYRTTGCDRTGCIFCGFGAHLEKGEGRFERLKRTHPKQYDYCMGGRAYGEDGIWRPSKEGLGMAHVIDELCRLYGPGFIRY